MPTLKAFVEKDLLKLEKDSAIDQKDDNNADFDRHNDHRSVFLFGEIRGQPKGIEQPFDKNNSRSSGYAFHFYRDLFEEIILGQSHKTLEILSSSIDH